MTSEMGGMEIRIEIRSTNDLCYEIRVRVPHAQQYPDNIDKSKGHWHQRNRLTRHYWFAGWIKLNSIKSIIPMPPSFFVRLSPEEKEPCWYNSDTAYNLRCHFLSDLHLPVVFSSVHLAPSNGSYTSNSPAAWRIWSYILVSWDHVCAWLPWGPNMISHSSITISFSICD